MLNGIIPSYQIVPVGVALNKTQPYVETNYSLPSFTQCKRSNLYPIGNLMICHISDTSGKTTASGSASASSNSGTSSVVGSSSSSSGSAVGAPAISGGLLGVLAATVAFFSVARIIA